MSVGFTSHLIAHTGLCQSQLHTSSWWTVLSLILRCANMPTAYDTSDTLTIMQKHTFISVPLLC